MVTSGPRSTWTMKKVLMTAAAFAALSTAAFAADLPSKKSVYMAPTPAVYAFSWTGAYIGGQVGGIQNRISGPFTNAAGVGGINGGYSTSRTSFMLGGYAGYNYQFAGNIVVGVETDINAVLGNRGRVNNFQYAVGSNYDITTRQTYNGAVRGRLGYAYDRALFYVAGGFAYGNAKTSYAVAGTAPTVFNNSTHTGYTLGAGVDYAITNNIIARLEYRYTDLGHKSFVDTTNNVADRVKLRSNAVLLGVAYKF